MTVPIPTTKAAHGLNNSNNHEDSPSLLEISSQFLEMVPVRKLKWKDEEADILAKSQDLQRQLLESTVQGPVCQTYPPSLTYMRYFLKLLIHKLESEDADICDEMYEAYAELMSRHEDEEDSLCYKSYRMPTGKYISLQESVHLVSEGTTGLNTWQAAQYLAEWVVQNADVFAGRSVLELGCGLGLTGIVTCQSCDVKSYTFTDCHSQVLYLLSKNVSLNLASARTISQHQASDAEESSSKDELMLGQIRRQLNLSSKESDCSERDMGRLSSSVERLEVVEDNAPAHIQLSDLGFNPSLWDLDSSHTLATLRADDRVSIGYLDWESIAGSMLEKLKLPDIILAADVVYDTRVIPALVFVLKGLLSTQNSSGTQPKAYVASTIRNEDTVNAFLIAVGSEGLQYRIVESPVRQIFYYDRSVPVEIIEISAS